MVNLKFRLIQNYKTYKNYCDWPAEGKINTFRYSNKKMPNMHQINLMNRVYLSSGIFERKNNLIKIEQIYRGSSELEEFFIFCTKNGRAVR